MPDHASYALTVDVEMPYETAVARTREELGKEGFGVLTEIDVEATLKKKLDVAFRPYIILGACNPALAHRALEAEPAIGLLLPCNVVVEQTDDGSRVSAIDPMMMLETVRNKEGVREVATEARTRLERVLEALAGG